jgi:hypothetical protein
MIIHLQNHEPPKVLKRVFTDNIFFCGQRHTLYNT